MSLHPIAALVTLASSEFEQLVQFYSQLLDQEPSPWIPDQYAEFHLPGLRLGLFRPRGTSKFDTPSVIVRSGGMALCLEVADLDAAIAYLSRINVPFHNLRTASHGREMDVSDPDGNWLILHQPWNRSPAPAADPLPPTG